MTWKKLILSTLSKGVRIAGALARNVKTTGARVSFRPTILSHMMFLKLPVVIYLVFYCEMLDDKTTNTQAYPTHKACLCHKQHGKLLCGLWLAAKGPFNNYVTLFCRKTDPLPLCHTLSRLADPTNNYVTTHDLSEFTRRQISDFQAKNLAFGSDHYRPTTRDVVLGTRTHTRVQLEYKFLVLVLVLVLIDKVYVLVLVLVTTVLVLVLVRTVLVLVTTVHMLLA